MFLYYSNIHFTMSNKKEYLKKNLYIHKVILVLTTLGLLSKYFLSSQRIVYQLNQEFDCLAYQLILLQEQ